jgi:hypothetical protein
MDTPNPSATANKAAPVRLGFYIHLAVFIAVNILLIFINLSTSTDRLWFKWPLLGWGVGLVFHAVAVFFFAHKPASQKRWART